MKQLLWTCILMAALVMAGCHAEPRVALVPVHGRVTVGQKALGGLTIQLVPDTSKGTHAPAGIGQTDEAGSFQVTSPPHGDGAAPGHYRVTVTSYTGKGVPSSYADPRTTPVRVEIPPAGLDNWRLRIDSR